MEVSWFRTHPPFYQRMVQSEREIMYLEQKPEAITQTSAFEQMKKISRPSPRRPRKKRSESPAC